MVTENSGLCGLDGDSFPGIRDYVPCKNYREFTRMDMFVLRSIFELQGNDRYKSVDFSNYMDLRSFKDIAMLRGGHLLSLFGAHFASDSDRRSVYIYFVLRTETEAGVKFEPKLFARSLPSVHTVPGSWMNESSVWDFVDTSVVVPAMVLATT